ncbi:hypothetical protein FA014_02015 [Cellulomonas hominis]|uniref:Uncharacterized protein n=1 Tax=Cellulomonas hominis TaxID=156981 RepID=A0A7Z8K2I3_9CELL|nr:hypothetical protein [Cellulomonas hominis]TKR27156.1 hypothetical protein FA014_02015 [Cellulomonas hominis]
MPATQPPVDIASVFTGPIAAFPDLDGEPAVIRLTLENVSAAGITFDVATNLGAGQPIADTAHAVGAALHRLSHALMAGVAIDLTTPASGGAA